MSSLVISTLLGQKLPMPRWTVRSEPPIGATGQHGAPDSASIPSSSVRLENGTHTYSWLSLPESVLALLVTANKLGANPSPLPCAMSPKPLFWQTTETPPREVYSPELGLAFTRLYHNYKNEDPAPKPHLALPISVIEDVMKHEGALFDPKTKLSPT
jgi:hypothetical protein